MPYDEAKVYFDGSHYIAIPNNEKRYKAMKKLEPANVDVKENFADKNITRAPFEFESVPFEVQELENGEFEDVFAKVGEYEQDIKSVNIVPRKVTRKQLFEESYDRHRVLLKKERNKSILEDMLPYFKNDDEAKAFVRVHLDRKERNLIMRRIRLTRKANLQEFNYFCTFTYDAKKHTEESFRYKLKHTLSNFVKRKGWKHISVWERSVENNRLHFHGIFYIPDGTMPGEIIEVNDYNFNTHRRQITHQNTYFNNRFGRSDMELIDDPRRKGDAIAYLLKYIEKTGERIVYSKGLPQFFVSDILEEDVVTRVGVENTKLLLFDDFSCFDNGQYIGAVSSETISQLRRIN